MRNLLRAALTLLLLLVLTTAVSAEGSTVTAMHTECSVERDGACTVQIEFTADFAADAGDFEVPISPAAKEISCSAAYSLRSGDGCKLLVLTGNNTGKNRITVSYRLAETVTDDGTAQEFSVQLLYPAWSCAIGGYSVDVHLPGSFDALPVFLSGYYGDLIDNYMQISINEGDIHAVLNPKQTLQDHEAMTLQLRLPRDFFDLRFLAGKTVRVDRLLFLGFLALAALYWLIFLRNLPILPKRQVMPPEGSNAGEIPYLLTGRSPDLALMVVQWASLGYLTVTRSRKGRIWLTRQIDMGTERKHCEGEIFNALFARGDHCDVRSAEYLKARRLSQEKPRDYWRDRIYDPKAGAPFLLRLLALGAGLALCLACFDLLTASKSWRWFLIVPLTLAGGGACLALQAMGGFLLRRHSLRTAALGLLSAIGLLLAGRKSGLTGLMLLNLALQLGVGLLLRLGGRRTAEGAALAAELLGYRRWLLSASGQQLNEHLAHDPQFFYRVLPYADALRAGKLLAGGLDRTRMEDCGWLLWEGKRLATAPGFYKRYCRLMAGLRGEKDPGAQRKPPASRNRAVSTRTAPPARRRGSARQNTNLRSGGNKSRRADVQRRPRP